MAETKKVEEAQWESTSFESALTPGPNQRIEEALLTSYSADLPAVAVALGALAGYSGGLSDRVGPGKLTLVHIVEQLKSARVKIAVQSGRLQHATRARIAVLFDRFLCEVKQDEAIGSWHPKSVLLCFRNLDAMPGEPSVQWRFWMGSRNLVSSENAELGLLIESDPHKGKSVPGLSSAAHMLARRAGYTSAEATRLLHQLDGVLWTMPPGCGGIEVRHHTGAAHSTKLFEPEEQLQELIVVSPFLDVTTLATLGSWGTSQTTRTLVSTSGAFEEIAYHRRSVLQPFASLLQFGAPELKGTDAANVDPAVTSDPLPSPDRTPESGDLSLGDGEFTPYRRLHAKLIAMAHGRGRHTIWMGSANATGRGWNGANVELMARMEVNSAVWKGLKQWTKRAALLDPASLGQKLPPEDPQKALERERSKVAARWDAVLHFENDRTRLVAKSLAPAPQDASTVLRVSLFTQDAMHWWKQGEQEVELGAAALPVRTAFVRVSLTSADGASLHWLQCCATEPALDDDRDHAAIGEYIGINGAMSWWKAMLRNARFDGEEESWDSDGSASGANREGPNEDNLTLEDLLSGWARSPSEFNRNGENIERYLQYLGPPDAETPEARKLAEILRLWKMLKEGQR
ncbi:MAG: phospholipase D family protein [Terracidiphilus sp.]|jgi:hypothetical protein